MRTLLVLLAPLLASLLAAPAARAHGGNFRETGPQGPAQEAPDMAPTRSRPVTTERATWMAGDWQTWWRLNRGGLLPDKRSVRARVEGITRSSLFQVGRVGSPGLTHWRRALERGAVETVLPFLLELLDPRRPEDPRVVSAALIALGRIARDPQPVRLMQRLGADADQRLEVRESAVLALGLMRRSARDAQMPPGTLAQVRGYLLGLFDEKDAPARVRAFAVYGLALLSDQPYPEGPLERDGRRITQALWQRLLGRHAAADLPVALLTALGMQPAAGVPAGVLEGLATIASGKALRGRRWDALRRSHALSAYVRLGGPGWLHRVQRVLRGTHEHAAVRAAAAIALARRAGDLDADERREGARALLRDIPREPHWFVSGLEQIALANLLREDLRAGGASLVEDLRVPRHLQRLALRGRSMSRPFSALALGLACHGVEPVTKVAALTLKELREALRKGLLHGRGSDEVLGAYAVGLGLAGAGGAHHALLEILQDRRRGPALRGHCAVALAQIGHDTPRVRAALHAAARERVSPWVHMGAVRALSLLAPPDTGRLLLRELETTRSRFAVAVVAGALGRFGDPAATSALVRLARDRVEAVGVRTMSIVALGLIYDPEPRPSRVRFTTHANYPSRTASLTQVFHIM